MCNWNVKSVLSWSIENHPIDWVMDSSAKPPLVNDPFIKNLPTVGFLIPILRTLWRANSFKGQTEQNHCGRRLEKEILCRCGKHWQQFWDSDSFVFFNSVSLVYWKTCDILHSKEKPVAAEIVLGLALVLALALCRSKDWESFQWSLN